MSILRMQGHLTSSSPAMGTPGVLILLVLGAGALLLAVVAVATVVLDLRRRSDADGKRLATEAERWLGGRAEPD